MIRQGMLAILLLMGLALPGCVTAVPVVNQAQTVAIETRDVNAPADATFTAAAGAMLDAGYTIRLSDRDAGLLTGFQFQENVGRMVGTATMVTARNILVLIAAGMSGASNVPLEGYPNTDSKLSLCILVEEITPARSQIRIRTYIDGVPVVLPEAVAVILNGVERQVMLVPPAEVPAPPSVVPPPPPAPPTQAPGSPRRDDPPPASAPERPTPKPAGRGITDPAPARSPGKTR